MPNVRSDTQTLLAFTLNRELADLLDSASRARGENRSAFIRQAVLNYLHELGESVSPSLAHAPDRRSPLTSRPPSAAVQPLYTAALNDSAAPDLSGAQPRRAVTYKKARPPRARKP